MSLARSPVLVVLAEAMAFVACVLIATTWFGAWPRGLSAGVPAALLGLVVILRLSLDRAAWRVAVPQTETLICLALAVGYRVPALLHPWGWVNRDGAYGAFVALHLLQGDGPAPVFTEGANYQGTLKGHLAALIGLVTRVEDLSWLMVVSTTLLYLVFVAASMALARRLGGKSAALVTGLYLALSPRFVTVFSLNCTGQYVDILALGMLAFALVARVLDEDLTGPAVRLPLFAVGVLSGAALWQQPAALPFAAVALGLLALRGATWRTPFSLYAVCGFALGVAPPLIWNLANGWATSSQVAYNPADTLARVDLVPALAWKTVSLAFPLLAGLANADVVRRPITSVALGSLYPLLFLAYLGIETRSILREARRLRPSTAVLAPLLFVATVLVVWNYASGSAYSRPRYLLPTVAAFAVFLGVVVARAWRGPRVVAALATAAFGGLLVLNVAGTVPRLSRSRLVASSFEPLLASLSDKGIHTGYADFSLAAPVTMFTREAVTFSAALGPTPAYYSPKQEKRVREQGPDAFVLLPTQDVEGFRSTLARLGVTYRFDPEPFPTFYGFSRRVRLEEVLGFDGPATAREGRVEE